jgi:beta-lactam-binding protein with PASTA domain
MKTISDYLKLVEDGEAVSTNNVSSGNVALVTPPMGAVQKRKKPVAEDVSNSTETDNALADTVGEIPLGTVYADGAKGKVDPKTGEEIVVADEFECTVSRFLRLQQYQNDQMI